MIPKLFQWEETKQFCIYLISNLSEILRVLLEIKMVTIYNNQFTLIVFDPILISVIQSLKIIYANTFFKVSTTTLDMAHQSRDATSDVNHEIRKFYQTDHKIKEVGIVFKIPVTHHTDIMKIWSENLRIFKDSSILNNRIITLGDFYYIMKSLIQEIDPAG